MNAWPAMQESLPAHIQYERGIWGKAHGARSDFRWLARSHGFAAEQADLGRHLNLGLEDRPRVFTAWNVTDDFAYAVAAYPSRATDASGRRGFLEKQVLEWRREQDKPAVAVALALLSEVARLDDQDGWARQGEINWSDPELFLALDQPPTLELSDQLLHEGLSTGLAELGSRVSEEVLAGLYAAILGKRFPAHLALDQPLPPQALACLLLPLPRGLADHLSISGWIPSRRYVSGNLAQRWDVLVGRVPEASIETREIVWEEARQMARAVLRADPSALKKEHIGTEDHAVAADLAAQDPPLASWADWTAAMRHRLDRTTDQLIEQGLWPVWRRHARLQPRERLTTAMAWLTSGVWMRDDAPTADIDTWNEALDDIATLKSAHMKRLCPDRGPSWPWITPYEARQLADLAAMAADLGDLARLTESVETNVPDLLAGRRPLYRVILEESRFSGRLPSDALLWLLNRQATEQPFLDAGQWQLLCDEAGERRAMALAARDLCAELNGNAARSRSFKPGWGSLVNMLMK